MCVREREHQEIIVQIHRHSRHYNTTPHHINELIPHHYQSVPCLNRAAFINVMNAAATGVEALVPDTTD